MLVKRLMAMIVMLWISTTTFAQTRLGVLYTQEELTIWRQRAQSGPYKTFGDVSTNSPADWTRILKNADDFLLDPTSELTSSTFAIGYETEPKTGWRMRDAAFVSLILAPSNPTKSAQYAKAVRTTLLAQCRSSHTDFTTYEYFGDLAGWVIAEFMVRQLFAYDYIKDAGVLTTAEKAELNAWFYNAANFFARNLHTDLADLFPKRLTGDYSVKTGVAGLGTTSAVEYTHVNADGSKGNSIMSLARYYNNRRASHALIVGLVDVFLKNVGYTAAPVQTNVNGVSNTTPLEVHAKNFVKEWVKYSVYPDGMQGEFERSNVENPFKGFNYSTCNLFVASLMADAYARRGDFELYNFTTSEGLWGSQGGSKSIRLAVETNLKMVDGSIKRYYGTVNENNRYRNVQYLNDNLHYVSDIWYAFANVYWKSSYQKGVYTRTGPGTVIYPATRIGSTAGLNPWGGTADMLPGCLFMFGGMEGKVWPYPSTTANQAPVASISSPTTGTTLTTGTNMTINATASDADGNVTKVEFFNGTTKLGEDLTSPYSYTMNAVTAGSYSLTVKATDNSGATKTSTAVAVSVKAPNQAPTASISSPTTGDSFNEGASLTITATATDTDGSIAKVEFFNGTTKLGEDTSSPYSYTLTNAVEGTYSLTAKATDNSGATKTSSAIAVSVKVVLGQILREEWQGITGTMISAIPLSTTPTSSSMLTSFEQPSNVGDNYGTRIRGYVHPTEGGNYTFWIAGDDYCELWLSSSADPSQKVKIAFVNGYTKSREWTKYASQMSAPIALVAGQKYYIEALQKDAIGGDNLAVGWDLPNGTQERPIAGNRLSPFKTSTARLASTSIESAQVAAASISAYPNPVQNELTIRFSQEQNGAVAIRIADQLGQIVYREERVLAPGETTTTLNLASTSLKAGVYILTVGSQTLRIVKN